MKRRIGPVSQPQVAVRFDDEDRAILEAVVKLERLSASDVVRRAVRQYAKALGVEPKPEHAA